MSEKTPLVFAPGITCSYYVNTAHYRGDHGPLLRVIERVGFNPYFFQPDWRNPYPLTWAKDMTVFARDVARRQKSDEIVLAGFSCGALIATLAASKMEKNTSEIKMGGLVACSLSPWFGFDRVRRAHQQSISDLHGTSESLNAALSELELPKLNCPVQLYAGTREMDTVLDMHYDTLDILPQAESIQPPTTHNIFDNSYLQAVEKNLGRLAQHTTGSLF